MILSKKALAQEIRRSVLYDSFDAAKNAREEDGCSLEKLVATWQAVIGNDPSRDVCHSLIKISREQLASRE
jgi:hypothetical protein